MIKHLVAGLLLAASFLSACAAPPPPEDGEVSQLADALQQMGPGIDPDEARRAAALAFAHSTDLATSYGVTTSAILHNTLVNSGVKQRGLCKHYAEDMQRRLSQEGFTTLTVLRAIAEPRNSFRIEHSSAVIAPVGGDIYYGIIIDPWRDAGDLYWSPTRADPRYDWEPRMTVLRRKHERRLASEG